MDGPVEEKVLARCWVFLNELRDLPQKVVNPDRLRELEQGGGR